MQIQNYRESVISPSLSVVSPTASTTSPSPSVTTHTPFLAGIDPDIIITALVTVLFTSVAMFISKINNSITDAKLQSQQIQHLKTSLQESQNVVKEMIKEQEGDLRQMNIGICDIQNSMQQLTVSVTDLKARGAEIQKRSEEKIIDHDRRINELFAKIEELSMTVNQSNHSIDNEDLY